MPDLIHGIPTLAALAAIILSLILIFLIHKEKDWRTRKIYGIITIMILCASSFCLIFLIQGKLV